MNILYNSISEIIIRLSTIDIVDCIQYNSNFNLFIF